MAVVIESRTYEVEQAGRQPAQPGGTQCKMMSTIRHVRQSGVIMQLVADRLM